MVSPPSSRRVSATRASVGSTGWQAMKMSRRRSSPTGSSRAASRSGSEASCCASSSWPSCPSFRSCMERRRSWSIARCLAVAISQAPGRSGTPDSGQRSSAATQGVLRQIFGQPHVAHQAGETGDEAGRFDSPDRLDGAVRIGSRHGYQSRPPRSAMQADRLRRSIPATTVPHLRAAPWPRPSPGRSRRRTGGGGIDMVLRALATTRVPRAE